MNGCCIFNKGLSEHGVMWCSSFNLLMCIQERVGHVVEIYKPWSFLAQVRFLSMWSSVGSLWAFSAWGSVMSAPGICHGGEGVSMGSCKPIAKSPAQGDTGLLLRSHEPACKGLGSSFLVLRKTCTRRGTQMGAQHMGSSNVYQFTDVGPSLHLRTSPI